MKQNQEFIRNEALKQTSVEGMLKALEDKPSKLRASPATPFQTGVGVMNAVNKNQASELRLLSEAEMSYLENITDLLKALATCAGAVNEHAALLRRGLPKVNLADAALLAQAIDELRFSNQVAISGMGIINRNAA